ncbi:HNH/ENDO VII family nuclease, partial [Serratia marcescens]|uniref:HNH/ENDO VII family nuclease n=2 Tax=Serratia TaxID=613 RepID=UPI000A588FEE
GKPTNDAAVMKQAYDNAMRQYSTGSDLQKAAQAVTGALTALAGNNLAGALASGASPYLATEIKKRVGEDNIAANAMAHAVLGAVTAQLNNQSAAAGGLGAGGGELAARYIAGQLYPGKTAQQLSESEKQQVSALSQLAAGLAGGLATGDTAGAVTGGQAGKTAVENNALSDIIENKVSGVSQEEKYQKAQDSLKAAVEEYKKKNCAGISAEACSAKMQANSDELLKGAAGFGLDFVPIISDIKSFAEAQSALDYLVAAIGIIPGAGDAAGKAIKAAETALKKRDVAEASKLLNKASDEVSSAKYFGQERKYWSDEPIQFNGNKVYQRNDLFDPHYVDPKSGKTNIQLMDAGRAPIGTDGKPVNLHHMLQRQDGPIAEATQSFYKENHGVIHISDNSIPSGINRAEFNKWRSDYWKERAAGFK